MGRVVKEEGQSLHFKSLKKLQPRGTYIKNSTLIETANNSEQIHH